MTKQQLHPRRRATRVTKALIVIILTIALLGRCDRRYEPESNAVPVRIETAKRTDFSPSLTILGVVRAAQSVPLAAQQRGIVSYPPRFAPGLRTGERVARGETIAIIRNDDLLFQQAQAKLQRDAASSTLERLQRGYDAGIVRGTDYADAKLAAAVTREAYTNATRQVALLRLTAPAAGTLVVTKPFAPGTAVDPTSILAELVTGGTPVVESNVAASERAILRPSLPVRFTGRTSPPWSGSGHIAEVATVVDAAGTARVVSTIDRSAGNGGETSGSGSAALPPGSGVELQVELAHRRDALTVPEDALVAGGDGPALFLIGAPENRGFRVKRVRVETGGRGNGRVEITSGLRDGDRVVVSGADSLAEDVLVVEAKE